MTADDTSVSKLYRRLGDFRMLASKVVGRDALSRMKNAIAGRVMCISS